jgi:hypothetical protein
MSLQRRCAARMTHALSTALTQETPGGCCNDCKNTPGCNVWVYCPNPNGCGMGRKHGECWLKKQAGLNPLEIKGYKNPGEQLMPAGMIGAQVQMQVQLGPSMARTPSMPRCFMCRTS